MSNSATTRQQPSLISISCGSSHSAAILDCDEIMCWGRGEDGQLGHGNCEDEAKPRVVARMSGIAIQEIVCGAEYTFALSKARTEMWSWGWGDFGRLGNGENSDVLDPKQLPSLGMPIQQIACGDTHTLFLSEAGAVYATGRNQNGQLGLGTNTDSFTPQPVRALQEIRVMKVACGAEHSVACTDEGQAYGWGWGLYGNLGNGSAEDKTLPVKVVLPDGTRVVDLCCGWRHSAFIDADRALLTCGWSRYGQLGHGDNVNRLVPEPVTALAGKRVELAAGGWRHTAAVLENGSLLTWGWNKFGQLGLGHQSDENLPQPVAALADQEVVALACGWRHTMAITTRKEVFSWGRGVHGQLGLGENTDRLLPTKVTSLCQGHICLEEGLDPAEVPDCVQQEVPALVPAGSLQRTVPATESMASVEEPESSVTLPPSKRACTEPAS